MSHVVIRNHEQNGNEQEAFRDGYYARKPEGRLLITQACLAAFIAAQEKLERLHSFIQSALENGGDVEAGILKAGIFEEFKKNPNWRAEFIALGGDPKAVNAKTPKKASYKTRVYAGHDEPDGNPVAPTADGKPWVKPVAEPKADEGGESAAPERKAAE